MVSKLLGGKMGNVVVTITFIVTLVLLVGFGSGCQTDVIGPSFSFKALFKGENGDREYLSRGSGMSSKTYFVAGNPDCIN